MSGNNKIEEMEKAVKNHVILPELIFKIKWNRELFVMQLHICGFCVDII